MVAYRPDLPDFGAYLVWPEPGIAWIHPDDQSLATQLIPSRRVFRRSGYDGTWYQLHYGEALLRVRPTLWTALPKCDVLPDDRVELLSQFGQFEPGIASVVDVLCNRAGDGFVYRLRRGQMILPQEFTCQHFRPLSLRYNLHSGYYIHPVPKFMPPADLELLDVGELMQ